VNPALKEMFGFTEEEMLGESLSKLIPKRYHDRHIGNIERFLHGDTSQQRVRAGIGLRANGSEFPMESSLAYFHYGSTVMMLAIVRDITESKAQEDKIRQSEANLRSIMDSSVQAFWLTDTELHVQAFNKLTAQIVRSLFGREIILGDSILNYVQPEQQKNFLESARKALEGEVVVYEEKFAMKHGEEQWMELMYLPTYNAEGKTIGLTLSSFNTTERKIAYQTLAQMNEALEDRVEVRTRELVQLNNEKNEFLGIAAHDLKNPLAGILSSAEILSRYFAEDVAIQRFTKMIVSASDQMLDIIKNLLDVNRIESGLVQLTIQPVNLEILDSVVEEYRARSAQKGIIIHYESPQRGTTWVLGDTQSVRQILDNLISNAVKYSPQWKPVWVRVLHRKDDDGVRVVRVEVQDEGPGLTEEDKKKLFGKFARLSAQPTGGENSTGLGLSIVKKLVELQHGRVWCESTLGLGTTFIVELLAADV
jgi:PAS domain S-box-containing protein